MEDNKFNYVVGIALIILLVLVVYLGGKVKTLESRVSNVEAFLETGSAAVEELELEAPELEAGSDLDNLGGYTYGSFDDYYQPDYYDYNYDYPEYYY